MKAENGLRLGLCCIFHNEPITFQTRQAKYILRMARAEQLKMIASSISHNLQSLLKALRYCREHNIGCFRISSRFLPLKTHPEVAYRLDELPGARELFCQFSVCRQYSSDNNLRTTFHPDQFTLLSSQRPDVTENSIRELLYHNEMAELLAADVIMIHGGGAYHDKPATLKRLAEVVEGLPAGLRRRLAFENDDRTYTPADLLPVCRQTGIPLVYDVHHHRCNPDGLTEQEATGEALKTWDREPLFHLSSPRENWTGRDKRSHHDLINIADFPACWHGLKLTLELEAKAKEVAVESFRRDYEERFGGEGGATADSGAGKITVSLENPQVQS
ncbi:MAG: UV DNA damage repair endonuclease UvsE [Desulfoprunum sp.]|nr:UV DNA damage repair endonuclease UvsE [Desulfoprunum sp.]